MKVFIPSPRGIINPSLEGAYEADVPVICPSCCSDYTFYLDWHYNKDILVKICRYKDVYESRWYCPCCGESWWWEELELDDDQLHEYILNEEERLL